jgi:hypothetical protein
VAEDGLEEEHRGDHDAQEGRPLRKLHSDRGLGCLAASRYVDDRCRWA